MKIIIGLTGFVALLVLGFIAWITGGSFVAFIAGIFLLGCAGAWGATIAGILNPPPPPSVRKILVWVSLLCLAVIIWAGAKNWYDSYQADKRALANHRLCQDENEKWVKIPPGHYKASDGKCTEGSATLLPQKYLGPATVEKLVLDKECTTPCTARVEWGSRIEANGNPFQTKYNGCKSWFYAG